MLKQKTMQPNEDKKSKIIVSEKRYKMGRELGSGTFGKVFEAIDTKTGVKVAIKQTYQDKRYKNRELEVIQLLSHENIVELKDYYFIQNKEEKFLYLVMDIFDTNLQIIFKEYRKNKQLIQNQRIKVLAFQLFKGLYYLQHQKVCHRDLKPPNILINSTTNQLKICDFGSAKVFSGNEKNVAYIVSRYYRSPQLLFKYTLYDTSIDVWSAGCILAQFLTKEPIFPGDSAIEQLIEIIKILGTPTAQYLKNIAVEFDVGYSLPEIQMASWEKVFRKYKPEPLLVDLIEKILVFDIKKRLKPFEVLIHPYFHDLVSPQLRSYTDPLPDLFNFQSIMSLGDKSQVQQLVNFYNPMKPLKCLTSIQKQLVGEVKLETGDSTPLPEHKNESQKGKIQGETSNEQRSKDNSAQSN